MKEWIELKAYKSSSNRRELFRKENVVEVDELSKGADAKTIVCIRKQNGSVMDVYTDTDYDEIKAALVNDEEWAKKVAKRAVNELQLIAGSEGTTAEIYEAFERRLTEILKGED